MLTYSNRRVKAGNKEGCVYSLNGRRLRYARHETLSLVYFHCVCACVGVGLAVGTSTQEPKKAFFCFWEMLCEVSPRWKPHKMPICCYIHHHLLWAVWQRVCTCVCLCGGDEDKRQDGMRSRGFVWVIQIAHKSKTNFVCQGKFIPLYFDAHKSPFICISTALLWNVCVCVSFGVFHWGNNSVSAVAHNAVNNAAALSEVWGLHRRAPPSTSKSYNVLSERGGLMEGGAGLTDGETNISICFFGTYVPSEIF